MRAENMFLKNLDRTICIKRKIEFQTGSNKNVTGHVTFYGAPYIWGGGGRSSHFPSLSHTDSQIKSNLVSVITTAE